MTQSQYRCETCKNESCIQHKKGEHGIYTLQYREAFERYGCASHSDFQNEREKVLDKLDKRCEVCARGWCDNDSYRDPFNEVREWIKELREGKDGEQR